MKYILLLTSFFTFSYIIAQPSFQWAKQIEAEYIEIVGEDSKENIYFNGEYNGTVDFDPGSNVFNMSATANRSTFLLKLDKNGNFLWAKSFQIDDYTKFSIDQENNLFLTGRFEGTVDFDPGTGVHNLTTVNPLVAEHFILKLDSSGNFEWVKHIKEVKYHSNLEIDHTGNIYVTGGFSGIIDINPNAGVLQIDETNGDLFVLKMDPNGNFIWAKNFGGGLSSSMSMSFDVNNNFYLTGQFEGTFDMDPSNSVYNLISNGNTEGDVFISKMDSSGSLVWASKIGSYLHDGGMDIQTNNSGVYISGFFRGNVDFDPNAGTSYLNATSTIDRFLMKLDFNGNFLWAFNIGDQNTEIHSMDTDSTSEYIVGNFKGTKDFNPGSGLDTLSSKYYSSFVSKFDHNGNFQWVQASLGMGTSYGTTIEINNKDLYVGGRFLGVIDFDPSLNVFNLTATYPTEIFMYKMSKTIVGIEETDGDDFKLNIFPNPSSKIFHLEFDNIADYDKIIWNLTNSLGQSIKKGLIVGASHQLDLTDCLDGIYFLKVSINNKSFSIHTLIKKM